MTVTQSASRVEALSDGVFAIALTLLTLNIRLAQGPRETFAHAFGATLPQLLTYALSFAVIAVFWVTHRRFFARLAKIDEGLVGCNFVYLALIALIPFPSQVLGNNGDEAGAVVLYVAVIGAAALMTAAMWEYAYRRALLDPDVSRRFVWYIEGRAVAITAVFALSIPVAFIVGPHAAQWFWLLAVPVRIVLRRRFGPADAAAW